MAEQKDYNNQTEEDTDLENGNFEDDHFEDDYEEDYEEEEKMPPLAMAGAFLGLVALAAVICAVLWNFTHKNNEKEPLVNTAETIQDISVEAESQQSEAQENPALEDLTSENLAPEKEISNSAAGNAAGEAEDGVKLPQGGNEPDSGEKEAAGEEQTAGEEQADDIVVENAGQELEFTEISDTVTAKDVTNLRSAPSALDTENVVSQLLNGETLSRTGVNDAAGWSRLDYNGQTVYAVTGYLTTDLTYKPPVAAANPNRITTQDGRVIIFTDCDDDITPKEYVNLRTEPSTSQGEATARCQISNGTVVHRTGYSPDSGWSRVEYNGEILYVVSSMVYNTDAAVE